MKPRNKFQRHIVALSNGLPNIECKMKNWAIENLITQIAIETKTKVECLECGEYFSPLLVKRRRATCPHCESKLKVEKTRKRSHHVQLFLAIADSDYWYDGEELQLIRYFELNVYYKVSERPRYHIQEVLQHWILPNGKRETIARLLSSYSNFTNTDMEIRQDGYYKKYDVYADKFHPDSRFKKQYTFYGIDANFEGMTFLQALKTLPYNNKAESLLKMKQYRLFGYTYRELYQVNVFWHSIMISIRHKYKIDDLKIWFDMLELLRFFGKDLRNPHYICPKNLRKGHDYWVAKKRKHDTLADAKKKRLEALEQEEAFKQLKSKFFGIVFSNKKINVRVLESVKEVMEEGDMLKHCVFTNKYHMKEDSLILSATVNGIRTETVEVSLKEMKVVQCRGLQNKNSEYHDAIVELVNNNMGKIRDRDKTRKKVKRLQTA